MPRALPTLLVGWVVLSTGVLPGPASADGGPPDPVVIAVIDSGANPYLPIFLSGGATALGYVPPGATIAHLSAAGTFPQRVAADAIFWDGVDRGTLYHFAGTRLSAITLAPVPTLVDALDHGAITSHLAARDAPEAAIVLIQIDGRFCGVDCPAELSIAEGMEWIAAQDWIDVVSVSLATPGNLPERPEVTESMRRYMAAQRAAIPSGKIIVNGAGNDVVPPLTDYFNGPPWVIAVGGVEPEMQGEGWDASKLVDVVANFSEFAPGAESVGEPALYEWYSGTSFATPIVAGTLANAIHKVRAAGGTPTPAALRAAMNATGDYFETTQWKPQPDQPRDESPLFNALLYTTLPYAAQTQMGWGHIHAGHADEIARRVLQNDLAVPPGKEQAAAFQPVYQETRERFWAAYAPAP